MLVSIIKENLQIGGTERSVANISTALSRDYNVELLLFDGSKIDYSFGGELIDFQSPASNFVLIKIIRTLERIKKYKKYLRNNRPNIIFSFLSIHNPINRINTPNFKKIISSRDFSKLKEHIRLFKKSLDCSDALICNSKYLANYYVSRYPDDSKKVFCVYNIINLSLIIEESKENVPDVFNDFLHGHTFNFVCVGRFCEEKGFEYLLKAFALLRRSALDVGLVMIGDGELRGRLENIILEEKIDGHVFLTGSQKNPYKYMKKCDCFVLSSLSEGFPNVLVEAMSLSLPVVATNCFSGPAEVLRKSQEYTEVRGDFEECDYGVLVRRFNKNQNGVVDCVPLANALHFLLNDKSNVQKYRDLSFNRAHDFSENIAINSFTNVFKHLLKKE